MSNNSVPRILNDKPEPKVELRVFHKTPIHGWLGTVDISKIHGWADNPRIDLFRIKCEQNFGRPPSDDEIYDFMLSDQDFHIKELARSILYNKVRVPIILTSDGTLLDGNRRYVASRYAIEHNSELKDDLSVIPVWILPEDAPAQFQQKVLVECNFISDWKVQWPPYIKSKTVYEDHTDLGLSIEELSDRYGPTKTEIRKMINVMGLIEEYVTFNENSEDSVQVAYEKYAYFEEANNKCRLKLDTDIDFKEQFFKWMNDGKFINMKQISRLSEIRDNEEAWATIRSDEPDAVEAAIHIVQEGKFSGLVGGEKKVMKVIHTLQSLKEEEIASIQLTTLTSLKEVLSQVINMAGSIADRKAEIVYSGSDDPEKE